MSLAEVYNDAFGETTDIEKMAELEASLEGLSDEDLDKIAEEIVEEEGHQKLAAEFYEIGREMAIEMMEEI